MYTQLGNLGVLKSRNVAILGAESFIVYVTEMGSCRPMYLRAIFIRRMWAFPTVLVSGDRGRRCRSSRFHRPGCVLAISPAVAVGRFATEVRASDLPMRFGSGRWNPTWQKWALSTTGVLSGDLFRRRRWELCDRSTCARPPWYLRAISSDVSGGRFATEVLAFRHWASGPDVAEVGAFVDRGTCGRYLQA